MYTSLYTRKIIVVGFVSFAIVAGFFVLMQIVNLNQVTIFLQVAFLIWIFLWMMITLLYDIHFRTGGNFAHARARHTNSIAIFFSACSKRIEHFRSWDAFRDWIQYLLLPGLIFWGTVIVLYTQLGRYSIQQTFIVFSSLGLIVNIWFLKEAFTRKEETLGGHIFAGLSVIKIYAAAMLFGGVLALMRSYCLEPNLYAAAVFSLSFLLIYQALAQHKLIILETILGAVLISGIMGMIGYLVYLHWGYNYFTAAIFMTVFYNLFWGIFHYALDHALRRKDFLEILLVSLLIAFMVFGTTNFKEQISDGCSYGDQHVTL